MNLGLCRRFFVYVGMKALVRIVRCKNIMQKLLRTIYFFVRVKERSIWISFGGS